MPLLRPLRYFCGRRWKSFRVRQSLARAEKGSPVNLALQYFDFYYKPIFRKRWPSIRIGLLSDPKYCLVMNNYATDPDVIQQLMDDGAMDVIDEVRQRKELFQSKLRGLFPGEKHGTTSRQMARDKQDMLLPDADGLDDTHLRDEAGLSTFLPATETIVRDNLSTGSGDTSLLPGDAKIQIVPDKVDYPSALKVLAYPSGDITTFRSSPAFSNGCLVYYLMDAASVFPVVALGIQPGDTVLDMCAAPGGKSIVALQTLLPGGLVCNDIGEGRLNRLRRTMNLYIPLDAAIREKIVLIRKDATSSKEWDELESYDKVLVDVPCTTDRVTAQDGSADIFKRSALPERLALPERQMKILYAGLKAVRPGGSVVYSTCTLSPIQNDAVIQGTLNLVESYGQMKVAVKDLSELRDDFTRAEIFFFYHKCTYGQLIVPHLRSNFGPSYVCKLERIK